MCTPLFTPVQAFLHSSQLFRATVLRRGCTASGGATWEMTECTKPTTRDVNELTAIPARNYLTSAVSDDPTDLIFHTLSYINMALIPMHSTLPYKSPQQLYLKMYTPLQPTASSNFFFFFFKKRINPRPTEPASLALLYH